MHFSNTYCVCACILTLELVEMSIYEHQIRFEIQNQKVDRVWKIEYQAADRPPMERGPSAVSGSRQSGLAVQTVWITRARTVHRPCADRPRHAVKFGQRQSTCHFHPLPSLTISTRLKETLVAYERTVKGTCARTVRKLAGRSTIMSSSQYFIISWISTNFFKFGDSSDFLSDLELSNGFTNLIGGIASATHCECCAKIWTSLDGYFLPNCWLSDWGLGFLKNHPWTVVDRPQGGRGPSGSVARTVRPSSVDSPDTDRELHFLSLWLWHYQQFTYGCFSHLLQWSGWSSEEACRSLQIKAPSCRRCRL
jgi:hypothetical protein